MSLQQDGFEIVPGIVLSDDRSAILACVPEVSQLEAGSRDLLGSVWCRELAGRMRSHPLLESLVPRDFVAVQCTYFAKTEATNWLVAYHQDLSIPVHARVAAPSCSGWSVKQGVTFVQPDVAVLEKLVAVRVHLDESNEDNSPFRVIPKSHLAGRISPDRIRQFREREQEVACLVPEGGVLVFRPLLLHASSKSRSSRSRRVLHFLFGPRELPDGLEWCIAV